MKIWGFFLLVSIVFFVYLHLSMGPAGFDWYIIENVRLPRVLGAVAVGAALAFAGALLQTMYRNPLADPYVLGISGVAVLMSVSFYMAWRLFGLQYVGWFAGSLIGSLAATVLLLWLARRASLTIVLLAGVFTAFVSSALLDIVLLYLPPEELGYVYLALRGTFAAYPHGGVGFAVAVVVLVAVLATYGLARWISVYLHGEEAAAGLGVNTKFINTVGVASAALLTSLAVATVGPVGFIGLAAPHIAKWIVGSVRLDRAFFYIVGVGALLALSSDFVVRFALPREIPVTPVLSLVGVPVAVYHLWRYVRRV